MDDLIEEDLELEEIENELWENEDVRDGSVLKNDEDEDENPSSSKFNQAATGSDRLIDAKTNFIFRQTLDDGSFNPITLRAHREANRYRDLAENARQAGDTVKATEYERARQLELRDLPEEENIADEIAEENAAKKFENEIISDLQDIDAASMERYSPHPQKDVEYILNSFNNRFAEKLGYVYVVQAHGKDMNSLTFTDKISDFSGKNIVKIKITPQQWFHYRAHTGDLNTQQNLRRYLGFLHMLSTSEDVPGEEELEERDERRRQKATEEWFKRREQDRLKKIKKGLG